MSPARRRACVEHVVCELGVSERKACAVLEQHRSTQRKAPRAAEDEAVICTRFLWTPICPRRDRKDDVLHEKD